MGARRLGELTLSALGADVQNRTRYPQTRRLMRSVIQITVQECNLRAANGFYAMSMSHTFQYPKVSPVSSSPTSHGAANGQGPTGAHATVNPASAHTAPGR